MFLESLRNLTSKSTDLRSVSLLPNSRQCRTVGIAERSKRYKSCAFTLLELIVAVALISVLAALITTGYQHSSNKIEAASCMSNLRGIGVALASYHSDFQEWPQVPEGVNVGSMDEEDFWIQSLLPYGLSEKNWRCRTQDRLLKFSSNTGQVAKIHYIPSLFDAHPIRPQSIHQVHPWVMEIADVHGNGNHVLMSDGRVRTYKDIFEATLAAGKSKE
jgi:prepilin-type N-terminal cleavage/methylation domain-containing protein